MKQAQTCYEILGVPKDVTSKELKNAYRRLSKSLHPDVSKLPDAAEQFQNAKDAFDILKDEEARKAYDKKLEALESGRPWDDKAFAHFDRAFEGFYTRPASGRKPIPGQNVNTTFLYRTADVLKDEEIALNYTVSHRCGTCFSTGKVAASHKSTCTACKGKGFTIQQVRDPVNGSYASSVQCKACVGTGQNQEMECPTCHGGKYVAESLVAHFHIPKGVRNGMVLRVAGKGGRGLFDGLDGDLMIRMQRDPKDNAFVLDNGDVLYHLIISPEDLFRKKQISIQLPTGSVESFALPANRPGVQIIVPEAGLGKDDNTRGNLIYCVYPSLPKEMTT